MSFTNGSPEFNFPYYLTSSGDAVDANQRPPQTRWNLCDDENQFTVQPHVNDIPFTGRRSGLLYIPPESMYLGSLSVVQPTSPPQFLSGHRSSSICLYPSAQGNNHLQTFNLANISSSTYATTVSAASEDVREPTVPQMQLHSSYSQPNSISLPYDNHNRLGSDANYSWSGSFGPSHTFPCHEYAYWSPMIPFPSSLVIDNENVTVPQWNSSFSPSDLSIAGDKEDDEDSGVECRWGEGCGIRISNPKACKINTHLLRYHFQGSTPFETKRFRGMCEWDGCTSPHKMFYHSFGRHIATVHLGSTAAVCPHSDCGRRFTRGDAMARHLKKKHDDA
ncbi:hypothetical protein A0H81_02357 [Grifola frondosa]|uniref:C2H2-type domain-containing protein n=1 Tax=Grifola frondosa TaxID=5627 RepID=A0A1C7MKM8_GRIFR|nr:hypothetical protein A0H81_02357 [Grifola frondosa]